METEKQIRRRIRVSGTVQGVGFRPWIYRLATARGLGGHVLNDTRGVLIEVQGPAAGVDDFLAAVRGNTGYANRWTLVTLQGHRHRTRGCTGRRPTGAIRNPPFTGLDHGGHAGLPRHGHLR